MIHPVVVISRKLGNNLEPLRKLRQIFLHRCSMSENSYKVERIKNGFIVSKPEHHAVTVMAAPTGFSVLSDGFFASKFGLFEFYAISRSVSEHSTSEWQSPVLHRKLGYTPERLKRWRRECAARAIGKRLHAEWLNLLGQADPRIRELQRKIFSVSRICPEIAHDERLYSSAIIRDAMKYRAAAIAIVMPDIGYKHRSRHVHDSLPGMRLHVERNKAINFFDLLLEWRSMYSDTGNPYRSLDRTLVNYPAASGRGIVPAAAERRETSGWFTATLLIFTAAIWSAWPEYPHDPQENRLCDLRLARSTYPHCGQVREVLRGSTRISGMPTRSAL